MASELKFNLRFQISNLNYPGIIVDVVSNSHLGGLRGYGGLQTALEVTSDLIIELSDLNNPFPWFSGLLITAIGSILTGGGGGGGQT